MNYTTYPQQTWSDVFSQPSDTDNGRRLCVYFDTENIAKIDGYFTDPVVVRISGPNDDNSNEELFEFTYAPQTLIGETRFKGITNIEVSGTKINNAEPYGIVEIKELLDISTGDYGADGYDPGFVDDNVAQVIGYGNGIFVIANADGYAVDTGYGQYNFEYNSPLSIRLGAVQGQLTIGNSARLDCAADAVLDDIKLSSVMATSSLGGGYTSYSISSDANRPAAILPDQSTLVLLNCEDNSYDILNAIRDSLESAKLSDSVLEAIVSLRNNRDEFIKYVDSLNITGSIVIEAIDDRPVSAQLFDLVHSLNVLKDSSIKKTITTDFIPSDITVNENFDGAAVFSGIPFKIEKPNLITKEGSIDLWISPLHNLYGDFKKRVFFDIVSDRMIGEDGSLVSLTDTMIPIPQGIKMAEILSIKPYGRESVENNVDYSENAIIAADGNYILLDNALPSKNAKVVVHFIPTSATSDRLVLYKDENSRIVVALTANGTTYTLSRNISHWKKDEWHKILITWKTGTKALNKINNDSLHMYLDGFEANIAKYGEGYLFNQLKFGFAAKVSPAQKVNSKDIKLSDELNKIYVGNLYSGNLPAMARMANLRISGKQIEPFIDARGYRRDPSFNSSPSATTPVTLEPETIVLEDFIGSKIIERYASVSDSDTARYDINMIVNDKFKLVRGVNDGLVERIMKQTIKAAKPAHARIKVSIDN